MGGGKKQETRSYQRSHSESGSGQKWARPYAKSGINAINSVYNANLLPGQQLAEDARSTAGQMGNVYAQTIEQAQGANQFNNDILGGKYLQGNPHLEAMIAQTRDGITDDVNGQFSLAGRYGSAAHGAGLGKALGQAELGLRYNNYGQEMGRMREAAQSVYGNQAQQAAMLQRQQALAAELPYVGSNALARNTAALMGGGTNQSEGNSYGYTKGPGLFETVVGAGVGLGSAALM